MLCLNHCFAFPHFVGKYESHTRVHTGEKPFQCDICLQCYSTKSNLTVHKKKHDSDTPVQRKEHKCPFCNKLHASRKTLSRHVKRWVRIPSQSRISLNQNQKKEVIILHEESQAYFMNMKISFALWPFLSHNFCQKAFEIKTYFGIHSMVCLWFAAEQNNKIWIIY